MAWRRLPDCRQLCGFQRANQKSTRLLHLDGTHLKFLLTQNINPKDLQSELRDGTLEPIAAVAPTPPCRVLVVDDNVDSAESLNVLLKLAGNETRAAYDGLEALEAAAQFRPNVILLDIGLPELNGYEVARTIGSARGARRSCSWPSPVGGRTTAGGAHCKRVSITT